MDERELTLLYLLDNFSANFAYYRKQKGFSQTEFAKTLNISKQAVSKWEKGSCFPDLPRLLYLCNYFEISLDDFFEEKPSHLKYQNPYAFEKEKIKEMLIVLRKNTGLTQNDFSRYVNMTPQIVCFWEKGEAIPSIDVIKELCDKLDISLDDFFHYRLLKKEKPYRDYLKLGFKIFIGIWILLFTSLIILSFFI